MRFDRHPTGHDFFGRRFQLRMLAMVGTLALVLFAIQYARRPSSWYWLTGPPQSRPATDTASPRRPTAAATAAATAAVAIPAEDLANVQDDSVGLLAEEVAPYHRVLARARDLPQSRLEAAAIDAAFSVLQKQPGYYRGNVLAIAGDLRRLTRFPIRKNAEKITVLYEALIFTTDGGTTPFRVRFTTPPVGLPFGETLDPPVPVRAVGYFFKRDQYIVKQELRVHEAPLVLAQRIDRRGDTRPVIGTLTPTDAERMTWTVGLLGVVALLIVGSSFLTWRARRSDRRFAANQLKRTTAAPPGAIEALADIETSDPADLFRQMTEDAAAEADDPEITP